MNQVQSLKQSIEATLGKENVVIDIHQLSANDFYNITYYASNAAAEDWDLSVGVAWEPNYLDPSTYLDVLKRLVARTPSPLWVTTIQIVKLWKK